MTPDDLRYVVDKSTWGDGPWQQEPDRVDWQHAGLPCLMLRGPAGAWCGYVGLSSTHPWYRTTYDDVDVEVHGGLTYSAACDGTHICHVPAPGESEDRWWLGFDCAHASDTAPAMDARMRAAGLDDRSGEVYRDMAYARAETERLAEQVRDHGQE